MVLVRAFIDGCLDGAIFYLDSQLSGSQTISFIGLLGVVVHHLISSSLEKQIDSCQNRTQTCKLLTTLRKSNGGAGGWYQQVLQKWKRSITRGSTKNNLRCRLIIMNRVLPNAIELFQRQLLELCLREVQCLKTIFTSLTTTSTTILFVLFDDFISLTCSLHALDLLSLPKYAVLLEFHS